MVVDRRDTETKEPRGKLDRGGISVSSTFAAAARKTTEWLFVLAPLTLLYLGVALPAALISQPIARLFGLPRGDAGSLLLDLCIAALPIVAAIAVYLSLLKKKQRLQRKALVDEYNASELVQARTNRNLIYRILDQRADNSVSKIQVVWTPDGRCERGTIYDDVDVGAVSTFDAALFLSGA